ncbi:tripartite tricarboxylate transporter substrate binding protein [Hylemonella gracilis]|uniref:Tripartite tricarboxylate transporter substrate binding protein n=1 Tax=Hylemonella gracilis TaxID=80880 RepID=A0A4P6UHV5_9BURK|nr:tripartite tricarboxylate transporter substrate binding protein [Hylemonella gracilis]QBK04898.1 tripartite tricarboxylate transporter substrate binding protein [Hylemonella gracilis]
MKRRIALAALALAATMPAAFAADWPVKPITLIVPFPAGGSTDAVARLVAQRLGETLGQQVVVDNRAGAGGNLGTDAVSRAAADGYTLALSTSGPLANNKFLYPKMSFDPLRDLTPVIAVGEIPMGIAVNPALKAATLQDLLKEMRARPEQVSIGNPGNGTIGHLTTELVESQAQVRAMNVPYKGDAPLIVDVMAGTIDAVVMPITALLPQLQSGKLRGLAVTSRQRFAGLPNVPTTAEQGLQAESTVWLAVVGPRNLPAPIVSRLNKDINAILATPEARAKLAQYGASALGGTPQQLNGRMVSDSAKWQKVITDARITLE